MTAMSASERADEWLASLEIADSFRDRSIQSTEGIIGASDIGWCAEELRRLIVQSPRTDNPDTYRGMLGTWMHDGVFGYRETVHPDLMHETRLVCTLPNGAQVPVTVDEINPNEPSVGDLKTKDGVAAMRKRGESTQQQRWQRHMGGLAAVQAGLVSEEGLVVYNVWMDRSGTERNHRPFVEQEPFSRAVIAEASAYLDDVLYAVKHREEAAKEQPRHVCKDWCAFYTDCRGDEIEEGPITNPVLAELVDQYTDASEARKDAEEVMAALRPDVENVTGHTTRSRITTTVSNRKTGPVKTVTAKPL